MPRSASILALLVLALPAGPALVQSSRTVCDVLPAYRPAPDVEYTPGVDVQGRAVAPADLPGSGASAFQPITIPLTPELATSLGHPFNPHRLPAQTDLGLLTIERDRVLLDGKPLGEGEQARLVALCRQGR